MKPTTLLVFATAVGLVHGHVVPASDQVHPSSSFSHSFVLSMSFSPLYFALSVLLYFALFYSLLGVVKSPAGQSSTLFYIFLSYRLINLRHPLLPGGSTTVSNIHP